MDCLRTIKYYNTIILKQRGDWGDSLSRKGRAEIGSRLLRLYAYYGMYYEIEVADRASISEFFILYKTNADDIVSR